MSEKIRFGIISTGKIAHTFAEALEYVKDAEKTAVASRSADKAAEFAEQFGFRKSYGSYAALFADGEVDAVYIGTPHSDHAATVIEALNAGKHVLCEKPVTVNAAEAEKITALAAEKNLFFMEAMWVRFLPAVEELRKLLEEKTIGEIRHLHSSFSWPAVNEYDPESRIFKKELAGGALLDLGIYPISFASMIFGRQPERIAASAEFNDLGTDNLTSALFSYSHGATASVTCSFLFDNYFSAEIYGTEGKITIPGFWWKDEPITVTLNSGKETKIQNSGSEGIKGYSYEIAETVKSIKAGLSESSIMTPSETVEIMKTLDRIRQITGLRYPADS